MKRLKTSDGKVISLGNSTRRVRSGTHADALKYTDGDAGDLMVPFTEEEIRNWRNAKNLSQGTFTSMASVEEGCKAAPQSILWLPSFSTRASSSIRAFPKRTS